MKSRLTVRLLGAIAGLAVAAVLAAPGLAYADAVAPGAALAVTVGVLVVAGLVVLAIVAASVFALRWLRRRHKTTEPADASSSPAEKEDSR